MELRQVLEALPLLDHPDVLVGAGSRDDAAVFRLEGGRALVATVDFFTPVVDDARDFGAIAAANALSDVYAMGGRPLFALSLLGFPRALLESGALEAMVSGGAAKLAEAGVPVVGGHSIDDAEPKLGYAVVGEVDPVRMVTNAGAAEGDVLFLTKPLGSGLAATALKERRCPPATLEAAVRVMTHLNRRAGEAMVAAGAHAATDVTGYGLLGHALNLGVGLEIQLGAVPLIEGVCELAAAGLFPGGSRRNLSAVARLVDFGDLAESDRLLLCDAQTSGGLLVAIPSGAAGGFEAALAGEPWPPARIGRVTGDGAVRVVP